MPRHVVPAVAVALLVLVPALALAQAPALPAPPPSLGKEQFRERRVALARLVQQKYGSAVVLVRGAAEQSDMGPFVQDQDFLYLTGVDEPGLAMLLVPGADGALATDELLVPPFSRFAATWNGDFLAPGEETAARTGFAVAGNVRQLGARLDELLAAAGDGKRPLLVTPKSAAPRIGSTPGKAEEAAKAVKNDKLDGRRSREEALVAALTGRFEGLEVKPIEPLLLKLRPNKSAAEIELIRQASRIAAEGIAEAMKSARPGMYEFQLAAVARFVFSLRGAGPDAYAAIVGGGPNGCILHYSACTRRLEADDLIVMDYAPTVHGYCSDVTRTFPASGTFSPAQRKLVQDVYEVQQELIAMVKPGVRIGELYAACAEKLVARGYRNDHGCTHHVGLAVHDPSVDELREGMIVTVEPGAYLRDQGMGCRIEDTVLVTSTGCEVLSKDVPSTPDAIEKLMAEKGIVDVPVGLPR
ncbi:MAG: aminopeptidase P family protein [Planctomycetes bacterium]|nr:aminopeptidase P family protein [Planctomycetota bacterium]